MLESLDWLVRNLLPARTATIARPYFRRKISKTYSGRAYMLPAYRKPTAGWDLGPEAITYFLWMMTKELARADMSLARCWEGHVNSQVLISALGNEEQKERWFEGIVDRGDHLGSVERRTAVLRAGSEIKIRHPFA